MHFLKVTKTQIFFYILVIWKKRKRKLSTIMTNNENTFDFQWPLQPNYSGEKNWILIYLPLKALPSKHFELLIKNNSGITILNWKLIAYKSKFAVRPDFSPSNNRLAWNLIQSTNWYQNRPERKGQLISNGHFSVFKSTKKSTNFLKGFLT